MRMKSFESLLLDPDTDPPVEKPAKKAPRHPRRKSSPHTNRTPRKVRQ